MIAGLAITRFVGDFRFLSNFYRVCIHYEEITYPSTEHAFQAAKTLDRRIRLSIAACMTPGEAKSMGRAVELRPNWEDLKIPIMAKLIELKFYAGSPLSQQLLLTGTSALTEGNTWHDQFWGDCCCGRTECAAPGHNILGHILMARRTMLQRDAS